MADPAAAASVRRERIGDPRLRWTLLGRWFRPSRPPGSPADVVLVLVDTLRADHHSLCGYPRSTSSRLDRAARERRGASTPDSRDRPRHRPDGARPGLGGRRPFSTAGGESSGPSPTGSTSSSTRPEPAPSPSAGSIGIRGTQGRRRRAAARRGGPGERAAAKAVRGPVDRGRVRRRAESAADGARVPAVRSTPANRLPDSSTLLASLRLRSTCYNSVT